MSKVIGNIDNYKCNVSKDIAKIASEELREDEDIRLQSLEKFREWIMQNENILKCRLDSAFILRFLRVKKYSLPMAQELFMRHLTSRTIYPEYFHNMDCLEPGLDKIFSDGRVLVLKGKTDDGRRVLLLHFEFEKPTKEDLVQLVRAYGVVCEVLLNNEDDQIAGITVIADFKGIGLNYLPLFSPSFIQGCCTAFLKSYAVRIHQIHYLHMPDFFAKTVQLIKYFVGPKISNRIFVHSLETPLGEVVPKRMVPLEYGGDTPLQEMISLWKKEMLESRDVLLSMNQISVDENYSLKNMNDNCQNWGTEGSFRQLQID